METPTDTPIPLPTGTPTPTPTPVAQVIYTVQAPGSEQGVEVIYKYEMTAGDVAISMLLFGVLLVNVIALIMGNWWSKR